MPAAVARWIVRWASGWISTTYYAYARRWIQTELLCAALSRLATKTAIPLAKRIDHEAAVTQMIEESWWG